MSIDNKQSGARLRLARQLRGYSTLREFAEATGGRYTEARMSNYETGFRAIQPHVARELGELLGCSPCWLLCLDNDRFTLAPEEEQLVKRYREADPAAREMILRVIESLLPVAADEERLVKLYRDADPRARGAIFRVAESIAEPETGKPAAAAGGARRGRKPRKMEGGTS